ncbi:methyltransferase [Halomonas caseinilytica]|uniref:Methyltransferase domain-containing protein n=1 Tax=Halomonas caseinilytica TaxID=438744 RepID=A0A1M6NFG3_9GAMM|nr:methyltransferase [Halomonas caseinilytica]SHJ94432.1 Methyltransferase domain-containing protein [Halomonas caseinilytica]
MTPSHEHRFRHLGAVLAEWQPVWQPLPFQHRRLPWEARYPAMAQALRELSDDEAARLQASPFTASPLSAWLPVDELASLVDLPDMAPQGPTLPDAWGTFVGGRKWRQIQAFAPLVAPDADLVEWCAGKGHLARALGRWHGVGIEALEWQAGLCRAGNALAQRQAVAVRLHQQDVMAEDAGRWLVPGARVMALHACGDLHGRLLELAASRGAAVTLAPCCYQRTEAANYHPFSEQGRREMAERGWRLCRDDLAMSVQETVTAPAGVRRQRQVANAWRLGFDALQRDLSGRDIYLPVPSLAYGRMPGTFDDFCRWAAERKSLSLPARVDWPRYEAEGFQRLGEVTRLELVRHLFRRPLEIWLALDRVRLMEEAGFQVRLGTFCERDVTPRNLLIEATPAG